jgi:hypothetical protein
VATKPVPSEYISSVPPSYKGRVSLHRRPPVIRCRYNDLMLNYAFVVCNNYLSSLFSFWKRTHYLVIRRSKASAMLLPAFRSDKVSATPKLARQGKGKVKARPLARTIIRSDGTQELNQLKDCVDPSDALRLVRPLLVMGNGGGDQEQGTRRSEMTIYSADRPDWGWYGPDAKAGRVQGDSADGIVLVLSSRCVDGSIELEEHSCTVVTVLKHWSYGVLVNRWRLNL